MPLYSKTLSLTLPAAVTNGISTTAGVTAPASLVLNGSLTSGSPAFASLVTAQRVGIHSASDDTGITFKIVGTDRYGRAQSEVLTGGNAATVNSVKDYLTVTSITPSGTTAGNVYAGTVAVGSTAPMIVDWVPNGNLMGCSTLVSGTVNYSIQEARDDFAPAWDLAANNPNWFTDTNFSAIAVNATGNLSGPFTMVRLLINSGTGTVTAKILTPFIGGAI